MTDALAVHAVGEALRAFLDGSCPPALRARVPCEVRLLATGELADAAARLDGALTLLPYHLAVAAPLRAAPRLPDRQPAAPPLSLELHLLLTAWARSPLAEQALLAWAAGALHRHPVLEPAALAAAGWDAPDAVPLAPVTLGVEAMLGVWRGLAVPYRLSMAYVARLHLAGP